MRLQHIPERLQHRDGDSSQACKISCAGSLSILLAGRHSIFVQAPRKMNSNGKLEQRHHGGIAWMVMKAAPAYATGPTSRLHVRFVILHCNDCTAHSQSLRPNLGEIAEGINRPRSPRSLVCKCVYGRCSGPTRVSRPRLNCETLFCLG